MAEFEAPEVETPDPLTIEVAKLLIRCQRLGLANLLIDPKDAETVDAYVVVLIANGIDVEMLQASLPVIYAEEFYPKPGTLVGCCEEAKREILERRKRDWLASLVEAIGPDGAPVMAPPTRVRAGRLLPEGDHSGDGSRQPSALGPVDLTKLSVTALQLMASIPGVGPDRAREILAEIDRRTAQGEAA